MMKTIKKEVRQSSSIHQKIREGGFVKYKTPALEGFKNNRVYAIMKKIQPKYQNVKRFFKSMLEKPRLWFSFVDWKGTLSPVLIWIAEAFIEGVIANWSTHKLIGLDFGIGMIFAHGFLIKQFLGLYKIIKQNGRPKTILKKNERK